jgi:hypothetical protein
MDDVAAPGHAASFGGARASAAAAAAATAAGGALVSARLPGRTTSDGYGSEEGAGSGAPGSPLAQRRRPGRGSSSGTAGLLAAVLAARAGALRRGPPAPLSPRGALLPKPLVQGHAVGAGLQGGLQGVCCCSWTSSERLSRQE